MQFTEHCTESKKQDGLSVLVADPRDRMAAWELCYSPCPAPQERILLQIASPGKDQSQNVKYVFY